MMKPVGSPIEQESCESGRNHNSDDWRDFGEGFHHENDAVKHSVPSCFSNDHFHSFSSPWRDHISTLGGQGRLLEDDQGVRWRHSHEPLSWDTALQCSRFWPGHYDFVDHRLLCLWLPWPRPLGLRHLSLSVCLVSGVGIIVYATFGSQLSYQLAYHGIIASTDMGSSLQLMFFVCYLWPMEWVACLYRTICKKNAVSLCQDLRPRVISQIISDQMISFLLHP